MTDKHPGRDLDLLIAEQVMGWEWWNSCGKSHLCPPWVKDYGTFRNELHFKRGKKGDEQPIEHGYGQQEFGHIKIRPYSDKIEFAWEVVTKMREGLFSQRERFETALQRVISERLGLKDGEIIHPQSVVTHLTPADICYAALEAVVAKK